LIPLELTKIWTDIFKKNGDEKLEGDLLIKEISQSIEERLLVSHYRILRYVCELLLETARYEKMTKMNHQRLSSIFAPVLMHLQNVNSVHVDIDSSIEAFQSFLQIYPKLPPPHYRTDSGHSEDSPEEGPALLRSPDIVDVSDELDAEVWIENEDVVAAAEGDVDGLYFDEFYFVCLPVPSAAN
jgi:hypothetical protein